MGSIYYNNNSYGKSIDSPASDIILSSVMHIGGEMQDNAEDAIVALSENSGGNDLEDLNGVNVRDPIDGDYLEYDGTANVWINHNHYEIVTWTDGTDDEIIAMLNAYYNNKINIYDYWQIGDERIVSLAAMSTGDGSPESHDAQNITMVLMNEGGKTLVTPINGHSECAFIVGQKDCLNKTGNMTTGTYWDICGRRTWCNLNYKNALPSTLVSIFKEHQNITDVDSTTGDTIISNDYFALPSEKEVFGSTTYAMAIAEANNIQFEYYKTSSNRIKKQGNKSTAYSWAERSSTGSSQYCAVDKDGTPARYTIGSQFIFSPFGVI